MDHSRSKRRMRLINGRKGYSGIIAAIFMVLIALFLYFNVFMFILDRNTAFQNTTIQVAQMDVDRMSEQLSVFGLNYAVDSAYHVSVSFIVNNISPLSIEIVRVWIKDLTLNSSQTNYGSNSTGNVLPIVLQPGQRAYVPLNIVNVTINGASSSDSFISWFVTARGRVFNTVTTLAYAPGVLRASCSTLLAIKKLVLPSPLRSRP